MKEYLLVLLVLLFAWSNRDRVPAEYQFWRHNDTYVKVVNNSDQDLTDVKVVVWSAPHLLGTIKKGKAQDLKVHRLRDVTDVVVSFRYGDALSRHPVWIVMLGGTNDLGCHLSPTEILRNLTAMYERTTSSGSHVVAVTVPSVRGFDDYIPPRVELNRMIAEHCIGQNFPWV